jgi:O-antigen/teichoic acid export membrane protein
VALLTGAQMVRGLLRLLFAVVVARQLGPQQLGVYAVIFALVELIAVASGSGYADYLTREAAKDQRLGWGIARQLIVLRVLVAIPLVVIVLTVLWFLGFSRGVLVAGALACLTLIPRSFSEAVQGVLRGIHQYKGYFAIESVLGITLIAGATVLVIRHGGLRQAIVAEIVAATVAGFVALGFGLRFRTRETVGFSASHLIKKSAVFNLYSFIGTLYDRFDVLLLSKLAGEYAAGIYSIAYRALGMTQIIAYGALYSLLPSLSRNSGSIDERQRIEKALGVLLSVAFAVVLGTMVFAGPVVKLVLGPAYADSALALKILIWAVILRYMNYALNVSLLAGGHERVFVTTSLVCLGTNIVGNLIFIPLYSWRAAAGVTIATEFVLLIQNAFWLRRIVGTIPMPFKWLQISGVFAAIMGLAVGGGRIVSPLLIGTASVLAFIVYLYCTGIVREIATVWDGVRTVGEISS